MKRYIQELILEAVRSIFEQGEADRLPEIEVTAPKAGFGHFSSNIAMVLARKGGMNPQELAEKMKAILLDLDKNSKAALADIEAVRGFLNFTISQDKLSEIILDLQKGIEVEQIGIKEDGSAKKVVFEYSSPNTNKPLHIGHTRNDIYGMACIRLLRAVGYDVLATEVINDRGIHIMKSMLMYMKFGMPLTPESEGVKPDHFVGKFYAMFAAEAGKSEEQAAQLDNEAAGLLRKWEAGDSETRALWKTMNDWFYDGVKVTYEREGSEFDAREYESDIYDKGRDLVLQGVEKGVFQREEDGSVAVDLTEAGLDKKYLLRKDGTTIYITQDLYLWYLRNEKYHPDLAIVTTSAEQAYHFKVLSKLFELLGFSWSDKFKHLPYEHVYLGKSKMSSRAGNAVGADDLLQITKERVQETMRSSQKAKASADDYKLVEAIAFGAIKYGYLKYDRNTKIYFDLDETIAIEGNTGPYLQYAFARINSVLEKIGEGGIGPSDLKLLTHPSEQALMAQLLHYSDSVLAAAKEFRPSLLCAYLFELASKFSAFYDQVSVINAESKELTLQRAQLLKSVAIVLADGLRLLGIQAVEKL